MTQHRHRAASMIDPATDRIILTLARHSGPDGDPVVEVADGWDCGSRAIEWTPHDLGDPGDEEPPFPAPATCTLTIEEAEAIQDALDRVLRAHRDAQPSAAQRGY